MSAAKIEEEEPAAKVEFVQLLQDMIGDLTSQPEPIVIKLFAQDGKLLNTTAPHVADAIGKVQGVVDVLDGIENTISGPSITYQINSAVAARAGFTPEEIAIDASAVLEGETAATPVILGDREYPNSGSLSRPDAILPGTDEQHLAHERHRHTPLRLVLLGEMVNDPGETEIRRENLQRVVQVTGRFEGVGLGKGMSAVQKAVGALGLLEIHPRGIWRPI